MEPKVTEIKAHVAIGGKVQLVKYEQQADYSFSLSRTYAGEWDEGAAQDFQESLVRQLREEIEPHVDEEYQKLLDARENLNR